MNNSAVASSERTGKVTHGFVTRMHASCMVFFSGVVFQDAACALTIRLEIQGKRRQKSILAHCETMWATQNNVLYIDKHGGKTGHIPFPPTHSPWNCSLVFVIFTKQLFSECHQLSINVHLLSNLQQQHLKRGSKVKFSFVLHSIFQ